jgi:hypothetical protein
MNDYLIKEIGKAFVIGTDEQDILVCGDQNVARQIAHDAEHGCVNNLPVLVQSDAKKNPVGLNRGAVPRPKQCPNSTPV